MVIANSFCDVDRIGMPLKGYDMLGIVCLPIAAGTAVRFEPGQTREVNLINIKGDKNIFGFNQKIMGAL